MLTLINQIKSCLNISPHTIAYLYIGSKERRRNGQRTGKNRDRRQYVVAAIGKKPKKKIYLHYTDTSIIRPGLRRMQSRLQPTTPRM